MTKSEYIVIESYMLKQMENADMAHDRHHIHRVLNAALDIYKHEDPVDFDVLVAACLLHDIGREKQFDDLEKHCHAKIGSEMAYGFLLSIGWSKEKAAHVKDCIASHRYRVNIQPQTIEAKILFDADKLDVTGAIGIARTLVYSMRIAEPLYIIDDDGNIVTGGGSGEVSSFFQEYNYKLSKVYTTLFTNRAKEIAQKRQKTAADFYSGLLDEIRENYESGVRSRRVEQ
ncbi:MAG: HD domain-containing protein [Defluviitaleaceae bacterium]|nr:HD domain-containing protein [Defluviitaleaceae bacterium]